MLATRNWCKLPSFFFDNTTCALRWLPQLWSSIFENFLVKGQKWFFDFFWIAHTGYIYTLPLPIKPPNTDLTLNGLAPPTPPILSLYCGLQTANNLLYINSILGETSFWAIYYFLDLPSTISSHLLGVFSWRIWPIASRVGYK